MKDLLTELENARTNLAQAISSIPDDQFNTVPFKDSWTAGQVTEHIFKALGVNVLYGKNQPTERAPDENVEETGKLFLNMDIKMKSPDFIYPSDGPHDKKEMLAKLEDSLDKLITAAKTLDLTLTCLDFEIPGAPPLDQA
ncbi:DinB family protein [Mucilaginibacter sp. S1162]|uniref:DinB family protein n=1 Tax=Mucilaginibacter humi TaxID=2732510 RepID=A0ABX1VZV4_9SPHI|nr:DinB family protein [Mucilaginibacter humi]NNU33478.1 DinB family protein [Mucilaginibacter humi]